MALMFLCPLSGEYAATFPHVLESSSGNPPVPNPILELQEPQSFLLVISDADSCCRICTISTHSIEPFLVAVVLQRGLWTNQRLPLVTAQWGGAVLPVSDQWVQRVGLLVDDNEVYLLADLHTKTDLGEGCAPVGRQLGLLWVKPSLPSRKIVFTFITPVSRVIMKGVLKRRDRIKYSYNITDVTKF